MSNGDRVEAKQVVCGGNNSENVIIIMMRLEKLQEMKEIAL